MHASIRDDVRRFVIETFLSGQDGDLSDGDSFLAKGIMDSTRVLELIGYIEDRFEISMADMDLVLENLDSVQGITAFIYGKIANGQDKMEL